MVDRIFDKPRLDEDTYFGWQIACVVITLLLSFLLAVFTFFITKTPAIGVMAWLLTMITMPVSLLWLSNHVRINYKIKGKYDT